MNSVLLLIPLPPGASKELLTEVMHKNAALAKQIAKNRNYFSTLLWFRSMVRNRGPWDYKQATSRPRGGRNFEDFGNYHFGYIGIAADISPGILLRQAGRAQIEAGTSQKGWGDPVNGVWGGTPPYGDDPKDHQNIKDGIADAQKGC